MKGKCACLADFFLLQKKEGDYSRLIRENKIIGIACRVAASSNHGVKQTANKTPVFDSHFSAQSQAESARWLLRNVGGTVQPLTEAHEQVGNP
jgi:hypothetical protein